MGFLISAYKAVTSWLALAYQRFRRSISENRPVVVIAGLLVLFVVIYFWPYIFIRVKSGELGVQYKLFGGGVVTDHVYGEGLRVIFPWNKMFVYNVRVQEQEHTVELLTENGLKVTFLLSIRYYPERDMVGVLHQRVGPDYVEKIVIPQVVSVLRTHVGQHTAAEVFMTKRAILERIFTAAIEQVTQNYITIEQVIIRTITLPPKIQQAVEDKIQQQHIAEAYKFRLQKEQKEAKRKEIEAAGFQRYNEIISQSLTPEILKWKGIEATLELSTSENSKVIVIGNGDDGMPIILGAGQ